MKHRLWSTSVSYANYTNCVVHRLTREDVSTTESSSLHHNEPHSSQYNTTERAHKTSSTGILSPILNSNITINLFFISIGRNDGKLKTLFFNSSRQFTVSIERVKLHYKPSIFIKKIKSITLNETLNCIHVVGEYVLFNLNYNIPNYKGELHEKKGTQGLFLGYYSRLFFDYINN